MINIAVASIYSFASEGHEQPQSKDFSTNFIHEDAELL